MPRKQRQAVKYPLTEFKNWLVEKGYSVSSIDQYLTALRKVLSSTESEPEVRTDDRIKAFFTTTQSVASWRLYSEYMRGRKDDGKAVAFIPAEVETRHPRRKVVNITPLFAHAVDTVLDVLETGGLVRKEIVNIVVSDVTILDEDFVRVKVWDGGDVPRSIVFDSAFAFKHLIESSMVDGELNLTAGLLQSPWTQQPATWKEWQRLKLLTDEMPLPYADRQRFLRRQASNKVDRQRLAVVGTPIPVPGPESSMNGVNTAVKRRANIPERPKLSLAPKLPKHLAENERRIDMDGRRFTEVDGE